MLHGIIDPAPLTFQFSNLNKKKIEIATGHGGLPGLVC
jgi:hypothetical protein